MLKVLKVLIFEDNSMVIRSLRDRLSGEPMEVVIAETAEEAREFFRRDSFDVIALDGRAPSQDGQEPSLVGPALAREFREMRFEGFIIGIASDPQDQELIKEGADWIVLHKTFICDKLDLVGLLRELQGNYSVPSK